MDKAIKGLVIAVLLFIVVLQVMAVFKQSMEMRLICVYSAEYREDKVYIIRIIESIQDWINVQDKIYNKRLLAIDDYLDNNYNDYLKYVRYVQTRLEVKSDSMSFVDSLKNSIGGTDEISD